MRALGKTSAYTKLIAPQLCENPNKVLYIITQQRSPWMATGWARFPCEPWPSKFRKCLNTQNNSWMKFRSCFTSFPEL